MVLSKTMDNNCLDHKNLPLFFVSMSRFCMKGFFENFAAKLRFRRVFDLPISKIFYIYFLSTTCPWSH